MVSIGCPTPSERAEAFIGHPVSGWDVDEYWPVVCGETVTGYIGPQDDTTGLTPVDECLAETNGHPWAFVRTAE